MESSQTDSDSIIYHKLGNKEDCINTAVCFKLGRILVKSGLAEGKEKADKHAEERIRSSDLVQQAPFM